MIAVFTDKNLGFKGNTAAVVLLEKEWDENRLQFLAADFNQPATTFLIPADEENHYFVRWFAPDAEIDLCGHGSMAAIAFLFHQLQVKGPFTLHYKDGQVHGEILDHETGALKFKAISNNSEVPVPENLPEAFGVPIQGYFKTSGKDIVLLENENLVKHMVPNYSQLKKFETLAYTVTAPGDVVDFVSRTFIPHYKQLEDPATGSSHTALTPFWAKKLGKSILTAHQLSQRGGKFICTLVHHEVILEGKFSVIAEGKVNTFLKTSSLK